MRPTRPLALFDDTHGQTHWSRTGFPSREWHTNLAGLAGLLFRRGLDCVSIRPHLLSDRLADARLLVLPTPTGYYNPAKEQWEPLASSLLTASEVHEILRFLESGGRLLAFAYRFGDAFTQTNLDSLFVPLGCQLNPDAVIDLTRLREMHPLRFHFDTPREALAGNGQDGVQAGVPEWWFRFQRGDQGVRRYQVRLGGYAQIAVTTTQHRERRACRAAAFNQHDRSAVRRGEHDADGEAEFWPAGDHPGVAVVFEHRTAVTAADLLAVDRLLLELGGDAFENFLRIHYTVNCSGYDLQTLTAGTVEDQALHLFEGTNFLDLRREAAYELFELYYPEAYAAWERSCCDGLIFDTDRFLDSPSFSVEEIRLGERVVLIVAPQ